MFVNKSSKINFKYFLTPPNNKIRHGDDKNAIVTFIYSNMQFYYYDKNVENNKCIKKKIKRKFVFALPYRVLQRMWILE